MFGRGKIKIRVEDTLFSDLVRELANWKCVRCGRQHEPKQNTMDCSHYRGRTHKATAYDLENADALCRWPCHQGTDSSDSDKLGWEYQKQIKGVKGWTEDGAYTKFKKEQLGTERFWALYHRSESNYKLTQFERKSLRSHFRERLKELKKKKCEEIFGAR